jgi:hypothetical protein
MNHEVLTSSRSSSFRLHSWVNVALVMVGLQETGSVGMVYVPIPVSSSYSSSPRVSPKRP